MSYEQPTSPTAPNPTPARSWLMLRLPLER